MTIEPACTTPWETESYRELACHLRHRFLGERSARHIVGIDGYAGTGKSTFAARLALELNAPVLSTDQLVAEDDVPSSIVRLEKLLLDSATLTDGSTRQNISRRTTRIARRDPSDDEVLIVEGCGVGHERIISYLSYFVWIDAPPSLRRDRLARRLDDAEVRPYADFWVQGTYTTSEVESVRACADLIVDTDIDLGPSNHESEYIYRVFSN
jgi:uridine kinase